jgi:hypothetical protein
VRRSATPRKASSRSRCGDPGLTRLRLNGPERSDKAAVTRGAAMVPLTAALTATPPLDERFARTVAVDQTVTRTQLDGPRTPSLDLRTRWSVQQRSTATTALSNTFGFIQMRPGQRKQGYERLLRGVRDEEVAGSKPVTPTTVRPCQSAFR